MQRRRGEAPRAVVHEPKSLWTCPKCRDKLLTRSLAHSRLEQGLGFFDLLPHGPEFDVPEPGDPGPYPRILTGASLVFLGVAILGYLFLAPAGSKGLPTGTARTLWLCIGFGLFVGGALLVGFRRRTPGGEEQP